MKLSKEVKTALLAIAAIVVVIFGYSFMKGQNLFDSNREFYAYYDNVAGLSSSASVSINGLNVGTVSEIEFAGERGKLKVTMTINTDFEFSKNSKAIIYSEDFISGKSIKIDPAGDGNIAESGDELEGEVEESMMSEVSEKLDPLAKKAKSTMTELDTLLSGVNRVLDTTGQENLKRTLTNLDETTTHLNRTSNKIDGLLAANTTKLDTTFTNLSRTTYNFSKLSDSLAQVDLAHKLDNSLDNFNALSKKLNNGEGTLGLLLNDEELYNNLDRGTKQLEELLQDIKLNPKRYLDVRFSLFGGGKKSRPYEPPEDSLN